MELKSPLEPVPPVAPVAVGLPVCPAPPPVADIVFEATAKLDVPPALPATCVETAAPPAPTVIVAVSPGTTFTIPMANPPPPPPLAELLLEIDAPPEPPAPRTRTSAFVTPDGTTAVVDA
jgi:hypothetical protein